MVLKLNYLPVPFCNGFVVVGVGSELVIPEIVENNMKFARICMVDIESRL